MKAIVTGGAGFIGSNLVDKLIEQGHEVVVIDNLLTGNLDNVNPKATFIKRSITNKDLITDSRVKGADVVFHVAAMARVQPSIENPLRYHDVNVTGTLNMLKMCVENNIKKFVFSSSSSVYGDTAIFPTPEDTTLRPMSPYALHKLMGEQYCELFQKLFGIQCVSLRYFNVYGERQPTEGAYCLVMGVFAQQMKNKQDLTINGDGEQKRDFTYVGDVVNANITASQKDFDEHKVFNIGAGDNKSVNHIADLFLAEYMGGKKVHNDPVIEPRQTLADNQKAYLDLGWESTNDFDEWCKEWIKSI